MTVSTDLYSPPPSGFDPVASYLPAMSAFFDGAGVLDVVEVEADGDGDAVLELLFEAELVLTLLLHALLAPISTVATKDNTPTDFRFFTMDLLNCVFIKN